MFLMLAKLLEFWSERVESHVLSCFVRESEQKGQEDSMIGDLAVKSAANR